MFDTDLSIFFSPAQSTANESAGRSVRASTRKPAKDGGATGANQGNPEESDKENAPPKPVKKSKSKGKGKGDDDEEEKGANPKETKHQPPGPNCEGFKPISPSNAERERDMDALAFNCEINGTPSGKLARTKEQQDQRLAELKEAGVSKFTNPSFNVAKYG